MATNNSTNLKVTNNADGFDVAGGTTARRLTLSGADVAVVGSGTAVITFPTSTSTLATIALAETLTNKTLTSPTINTGSFGTSITGSYLTASEMLGTGASKEVVSLPVATYPSLTQLTYLKGVTSAIQTQLNAKGVGDMVLASAQTNSGIKTFLDTTMKLRNVANTFDGYFVNTNTADRIYTLKDAAGTIAFTTDITGTNSGTNTGDNSANTLYSGLAASKADVGQTMYIGTTQIAINRASAALVLTGITSIDGTAATVTGAAQASITSLGTLTTLTVDDIAINGNTISSAGASTLAITPTAGQTITFDGTITLDAGVIAGATSITSTTFVGALTGNASGSALTVTQAAQTAITSVGTLTALAVDNITIDLNTISSTAGTDLNITPLAGQQIVLDGTIVVDAGVVTGATSITSTTFVGALTGTASGNLVSGGALGTPSSGTLTNATGLPAAAVVAGTFGTGAYTMSGSGAVPLTLYRTSVTSNVSVELKNDTGSWFMGQNASGLFAIDDDSDIGTAPLFVLDSSGQVGIGITTPLSSLDVGSATGAITTLRRVDTTVTADDIVGKLQFYAADTSTTTNFIVADIEAQATNTIATDINPGRLIFRTTSTAVAATPTERMRIDEAGNIGIGATTLGLVRLTVSDKGTSAFASILDIHTDDRNPFGFRIFNDTISSTVPSLYIYADENDTPDATRIHNSVNGADLRIGTTGTGVIIFGSAIRIKGYTVAALPAGVEGNIVYVTDQLTAVAAKGAAPTGGGAIKCVVFYNGTAWVGI